MEKPKSPPFDVAKTIDEIADIVGTALSACYDRDGELRATVDVDALQDTITVRVNAAIDTGECGSKSG